MTSEFTSREAAAILGIRVERLLKWVDLGAVRRPRLVARRFSWTIADVEAARTRLAEVGGPTRGRGRVRKVQA